MSDRARILVVDDEQSIRDFISIGLRHEGFEVEVAADGGAGLRAVNTFKPDLVVVDLMMPRMDGWEVCRLMKQHPVLGRTVRVIMVTALDAWDDKREALQLGADDYVEKPFDLPTLAKTVQRNLEQLRVAS